MEPPHESVPNPDPTSRTLQASELSVSNLEKYIGVQLGTLSDEAKLSTKGLVLTSANDQEKERLEALREIVNLKVENVNLQITAVRELQTSYRDGSEAVLKETINGRDVALAAALKAQQEQANLVQTHQKEALVQQQILFTTKSGAQDKEIADLRSRLDKGEGERTGTTTTRTTTREDQTDQRSEHSMVLQHGQLSTSQISLILAVVMGIITTLALTHVIP
jgi:hypothetical protein